MGLPAFASVDQLSARVPGGIPAVDQTRAQATLEDASALIRAVAGTDWVTITEDEPTVIAADVPGIVATVCLAAAKRAFTNPDQIKAENIDDYRRELADSSPDVYLTAAEKQLIQQAVGTTAGLWTLPTTRSDLYGGDLLELDGTVYIDVVDSEPFPFLPVE